MSDTPRTDEVDSRMPPEPYRAINDDDFVWTSDYRILRAHALALEYRVGELEEDVRRRSVAAPDVERDALNVLEYLVLLKTIKESIERGTATVEEKNYYELRKAVAWCKARSVLAAAPPPAERKPPDGRGRE